MDGSDDELIPDDHDTDPIEAALAAEESAPHGVRMTPKMPPTFDGQSSWFEYEDLIDDWLGITTLQPERHGPSLKNSLVGAAAFYKNMLDNVQLRNAENGITYFKNTLRPFFVKGTNHVFLYRFLTFFRLHRGQQELVHWIGRFEITLRRLRVAWNDLLDVTQIPPITSPDFNNILTPQQLAALAAEADVERRLEMAEALRNQHIQNLRDQHNNNFPFTDNLIALLFLAFAELNEQQRERFVSSMSLRQIDTQAYTYLQVKQLLMELFASTRTGVADPLLRHNRRSTFIVLDEGDLDNEDGYWVQDADTGEEGFVSLYAEDDFWVYMARTNSYTRRRVKGRSFRRGKGKGRGKSRGKGKGKRPGFRPRSKGKGSAAHYGDDQSHPGSSYDQDWQWQQDALYGKKRGKGKKGGKKGGNKGFQQYNPFNKGGKEAFKGKGKEGKGKPMQPQIANVATSSSAISQPETQVQQQTSAASHEDTWYTDDGWSEWHSYDDSYYGSSSWNDDYSWSYFVEVRSDQTAEMDPECNSYSRFIGSYFQKLCTMCTTTLSGYIFHVWNIFLLCVFMPLTSFTSTNHSFYSYEEEGEDTSVTPDTALLNVDSSFLTCPLFGMKRAALAVSTSNHPVLDIMSLALSVKKPNHSFATVFAVTCPACLGKHRPHTYADGCNKSGSTSTKTKKSSEPSASKEDSKDKSTASSSSGADAGKRLRRTRVFAQPDTPLGAPPGPQPKEVPPEEEDIFQDPIGPQEPADGEHEEDHPEQPVKPEPKVEVKIEEKKEPAPKMKLPVALQRIHDKLQSPTELLKLHLKHYHMSTEQFRRRTSALKLPKEIYDKYDLITKQCDTCQKSKTAPSRSKVSGIRSEVFGELSFTDHAAMNGLRVGQPIDPRTGYDLLTSEGRAQCMKIIEEQRPEVVFMAPVCGPWSIMQNINDWYSVEEKRRKYLPMIEFCARVAKYQLSHGRHFILENPQTSQIWYTRALTEILMFGNVTYGTLDMCAYGMKDPNVYSYYKPTSLLHSFSADIMAPIFKRCPNKKLGGESTHSTNNRSPVHYHQPLEGNAPGHGSRTKLAQIYPYRFCSTLIRTLLPLGNLKGLVTSQTGLLVDLLEQCFQTSELLDLQKILGRDEAPVYTSTSKDTAIAVKQHHSRRTLVFINSLSTGYTYDPLQLELHSDVSTIRQRFIPQMPFENAIILRGTLSPLRLQYGRKHGVLLMWRKKDHTQVYLLQHPQTDLSQLIPKQWSAIFFWNSSGEVPTPADNPEPLANVAPPPGLDPDQNMPPVPPNNPEQQQDENIPPDNPPPDFPQPPDQGPPDQPFAPAPIAPPNPPADPHQPHDPTPNHLGGDVPVSQSSSQPQNPFGFKGDNPFGPLADDDDDDYQDPDAAPSGPVLPFADEDQPAPPTQSARPHRPQQPKPLQQRPRPKASPKTSPQPSQPSPQLSHNSHPSQQSQIETVTYEEEEEESEDDDDTDGTLDYNDLCIDEDHWSSLTVEQKICSNTGSFTAPRYIDGSAIPMKQVHSSTDYLSSFAVRRTNMYKPTRRKTKSDIIEEYNGIDDDDKSFLTLYQVADYGSLLVGKKRKEATQREKRQLAKQFLEAKKAECKSWIDNDVFDLVDMRKTHVRNFVYGRWVLTVKKDKDGNFQKCKARWVLKGFQDEQKNSQQTDSPAASRSGFRCCVQLAANKQWNLYHMDLKTAFLQGEIYDESRDIICQIPPEYGYPPYIGARMKKSAYGLKEPFMALCVFMLTVFLGLETRSFNNE
eukprot:Skav228845  [mRNA]  locus=scaffold2630:88:7077:+ [translate_table: standard]